MRWIVLVFLLVVAGCVGQAKQGRLSFEPGKAKCGAGGEYSAEKSDAGILFSGAVSTPNPCYSLRAKHSVTGDTVRLDISAEYKGGMCIQCLGRAPFEGRITGLEEKQYLFVIAINGNAVFEKRL